MQGLFGIILILIQVNNLKDDWLLQKDGTIYPHFNTGQDLMHDGRWGNVPTINGKFRPEYTAKPGERIRLRLINGANARIYPGIAGMTLCRIKSALLELCQNLLSAQHAFRLDRLVQFPFA